MRWSPGSTQGMALWKMPCCEQGPWVSGHLCSRNLLQDLPVPPPSSNLPTVDTSSHGVAHLCRGAIGCPRYKDEDSLVKEGRLGNISCPFLNPVKGRLDGWIECTCSPDNGCQSLWAWGSLGIKSTEHLAPIPLPSPAKALEGIGFKCKPNPPK